MWGLLRFSELCRPVRVMRQGRRDGPDPVNDLAHRVMQVWAYPSPERDTTMMKRFWPIAAATLLATASCSSDDAGENAVDPFPTADQSTEAPPASDVLVGGDKYTVCAATDAKPFAFKDEANAVVGFDVDVVTRMGEVLGGPVTVVEAPRADILSGKVFADRLCDMGAGALRLTAEAEESVRFTDAYHQPTQALVVKADSPLADVEGTAGQPVAVVDGSTGQSWLAENAPDAQAVVVADLPGLLEAVRSGSAAAGVYDNTAVLYEVKDAPDVKVAITYDTGDLFAFAMSKDGERLQKAMNVALSQVTTTPAYGEIQAAWFGTPAG